MNPSPTSRNQESTRNLVNVRAQGVAYAVDKKKIRTLIHALLARLELAGFAVDLSFVGDEKMEQLNSQFRHKQRTTDVLAFPQQEFVSPLCFKSDTFPEPGPYRLLGDIFISPQVAESNAVDLGHSLGREVGFLIIHGLLHLLGFDHQQSEDEEIMLTRQRHLVDSIERDLSLKAHWDSLFRSKSK